MSQILKCEKANHRLRRFAEDLKANGPLKRIGTNNIEYCIEWITRKATYILEAIEEEGGLI